MPRRRRQRRAGRGPHIPCAFAFSASTGTSSVTASAIGLPDGWPLRAIRMRVSIATTDNKNAVVQIGFLLPSGTLSALSSPRALSTIPQTLSVRNAWSTSFALFGPSQNFLVFNMHSPSGGSASVTVTGTVLIQISTVELFFNNLKEIKSLEPDEDDDSDDIPVNSVSSDFIDCRVTREAYLDANP